MTRKLLAAALLALTPAIGLAFGEPPEDPAPLGPERHYCPPCAKVGKDWERFRNFAIHVFAEDLSLLDFFRWKTYKVYGLYVEDWQDPKDNYAFVQLKRGIGRFPGEFGRFQWVLQLPNGTQHTGNLVVYEDDLPKVKPVEMPYPPGARPTGDNTGVGSPGGPGDLCGCRHVC